jgi:hypothetical protein
MAGDASAFAVLGLEPGADAAAVEQAYRRLIKQHHPDREGGDSARAAEINRAYQELKTAQSPQAPIEVHHGAAAIPRMRWGWTALALIVLIVLMSLPLLSDQPLLPPLQFGAAGIGPLRVASRTATIAVDAMDQPLHLAAIDGSVRDALQLSRTKDEMALAGLSRDCHRALRTNPNLLQFDRCAAFDDAVVQLEDRDPLRDQGPFSEIAVTGRIWSGATGLSDDSLSIDARLDRIRRRVQSSLAPAELPAAEAKN